MESVSLWVYKLRDQRDEYNQTITISELAPYGVKKEKFRARRMVTYKITDLEHGWLRFDIKPTFTRWVNKPHKNFGLKVSCKTCGRPRRDGPIATKQKLKPFLVVKMRRRRRCRRKRQVNTCDSSITQRCCRETFTVVFSRIGWNWIRYPLSYTANYCKGSCGKLLLCVYMFYLLYLA